MINFPNVKMFYCWLLSMVVYAGCQSIEMPNERYNQYDLSSIKVYVRNDTLFCKLRNPLDCPLRFYISTSDSTINRSLHFLYPVTLRSKIDTLIMIQIAGSSAGKLQTSWAACMGDLDRKTDSNTGMSLPFLKGKSYKIVQGYNGKYSHSTNYSRYAIDFGLQTNDTICAADGGYVVGVIKDYQMGGDDKRLEDFANYITLYHPQSGLYTQYVHLKYNGSLVKVGDSIKQGQAIGLAGMTGFTSIAHLHFNVLIPSPPNDGFQSIPIQFIEHYIGNNLRTNDVVKK